MKEDKYKKKYNLNKNISNPTVQPDRKTEMGVPIPDTQNVEYSKEYEEENKL